MALANWLTSYHREAPEDHIKCKWPISTAVISRGVLGIVDRSQLNRAFGKASGTLPPSVRDAAAYTLKKNYVAATHPRGTSCSLKTASWTRGT